METMDQHILRIGKNTSILFIRIPEGEFLMGSNANDNVPLDETPQHLVFLHEFWINQTPITNSQYSAYKTDHKYGKGFDLDPVNNITWFEAKKYCQWLSQNTGLSETMVLGSPAALLTALAVRPSKVPSVRLVHSLEARIKPVLMSIISQNQASRSPIITGVS